MIEGFQEFMRIGVDLPESMTKLKTQLLESADPVGVFLGEMVVPDPKGRVPVKEFYSVHEAWCEQGGFQLYQKSTVRNIMVEKGYETGPVKGYAHYRGFTWSDGASELIKSVLGYPSEPDGPPF